MLEQDKGNIYDLSIIKWRKDTETKSTNPPNHDKIHYWSMEASSKQCAWHSFGPFANY